MKKFNEVTQPATTIHTQFFLTMFRNRQILRITLLTEEALFTKAF